MRVLLVNHTSDIGGAEQSLLELVRELPRLGVTPLAAVPEGPLAARLRQAGVEVHVVPLHALVRPRGLGSASRAAAAGLIDTLRVCHLIRRLRPDLVHANSAKAAFAAGQAARCLRIPCLWHCRDLAPPGAKLLLFLAPALAISRAVAASLPRSRRVRVVRNGIDTARFDPAQHPREASRACLGLPPEAPLVAMVADFVPWKRHDLFLEAAARIARARPEVRFAIAGQERRDDPGLGDRLRARAATIRLGEAVHWLGHCPDTAPLYAAANVLLHPPAREPFGRVVCEALAMNCPVVVADAAGPAEIAAECPADVARRVPPDDVDGFANAVLDLLQPLAQRTTSREAIAAAFDIRRTAAELARVYAEVTAASR